MTEETYIPTIKKMKILRRLKKIKLKKGVKSYKQATITLPKDFDDKLEKEGVGEVIAIADDFFIGVPPKVLVKKSKGEIIAEFSDLLDWLKEHVKEEE